MELSDFQSFGHSSASENLFFESQEAPSSDVFHALRSEIDSTRKKTELEEGNDGKPHFGFEKMAPRHI